VTNAAFKKKKKKEEEEQQREEFFHQQIILKCKEEISEMRRLEHSFLWCCSLDTSESRSEIP
jgi:hypothetical protein